MRNLNNISVWTRNPFLSGMAAESGSKENTSSLSVHEVEERYEMDEEEIALDYACFETANLCYRIDYFPVAMTIAKKQVDK